MGGAHWAHGRGQRLQVLFLDETKDTGSQRVCTANEYCGSPGDQTNAGRGASHGDVKANVIPV